MSGFVLVVDQGTTSTRAIVFDREQQPVAAAQEEYRQIFPRPGWVEHDPEDLWQTSVRTAREALQRAGLEPHQVAALGIANQRETVVVWDRATGAPIANAIVWQDRRTSDACLALRTSGAEPFITERTGLLLDAYFSATKIAWLLDNVPGARTRAERGELACGTVDTFLIWRLTNGRAHVTDATNASRTLLYDLRRGIWDDDLLALFRIPKSMLPGIHDCAGEFGTASGDHFGFDLPIRGVAGDQQAALVGQACFSPGMVKSTYGTGCFALLNTGMTPVSSRHRLLSTVAYQLSGVRHYALEGSIFSAGATVQWLRDGIGLVANAAETGLLAAEADPAQSVYLIPAFAGLGAPHWDSEARGLLTGLTRGTTRREIARAALESVAFQTRDLVDAMRADAEGFAGSMSATIRVDGGMSVSDWTMQSVADIVGCRVDRPAVTETTALGAAFLAGWAAGLYPDPQAFQQGWRAERSFLPASDEAARERRYVGWRTALRRAQLQEAEPSRPVMTD